MGGSTRDAFKVNQLMHPYQGSIYYGLARSSGLGFWESSAYTFALAAFLWETGGETTSPSINDQVASGVAGAFFGEALFRMASLLLDGGGERPGFWRELGATVPNRCSSRPASTGSSLASASRQCSRATNRPPSGVSGCAFRTAA